MLTPLFTTNSPLFCRYPDAFFNTPCCLPRSTCTQYLVICPYCHVNDDRVIDSRSSEGGIAIRRRRVCNACGKRFTTYERVETASRMMVIKRDGSRQAYDIQRILQGIEAACAKLPIPADEKRRLAEAVEEEMFREFEREIPTERIGRSVMDRLRQLDQVAYVRFASVYKEFKDLDEMLDEVKDVKKRAEEEVPGQRNLFSP